MSGQGGFKSGCEHRVCVWMFSTRHAEKQQDKVGVIFIS